MSATPRWEFVARISAFLGLLGLFAWAYWPTFLDLVHTWETEEDYAHGYLVAPLTCLFLWMRRDRFPGWGNPQILAAVSLVTVALILRLGGSLFYMESLEGWSIPIWIAGAVLLLGGGSFWSWCLPAIGFLFFMVPLPFRAEQMLSFPLQRFAARLSAWALQCMGQPALAEGNTLWLGDQQLEVEQACSGLRILMGIFAIAYAYLILTRRNWWERGLLILTILPITLIANSTRIVVTGLLFQSITDEATKDWAHDMVGWAVLPLAAAMFALVLSYLSMLMREEEVVSVGELVRSRSA
ncbi:Eight transmembrane protein EpsH [Planctomycetales bacterium 10988]|nr:Eight transmembrane protein EpsH [Planctomycetales bacterium 10988]